MYINVFLPDLLPMLAIVSVARLSKAESHIIILVLVFVLKVVFTIFLSQNKLCFSLLTSKISCFIWRSIFVYFFSSLGRLLTQGEREGEFSSQKK